MIDFTNKYIITENDTESEKLLKKAISQGFTLPKGEKAMESCRLFHFIGNPYKLVSTPMFSKGFELEQAIRYSDLFGNELEELKKIADSAARWCRAYGYEHLSVYANEELDRYTGKGIAKTKDGTVQETSIELKKPRKITVSELEEHFGYPIEIVS